MPSLTQFKKKKQARTQSRCHSHRIPPHPSSPHPTEPTPCILMYTCVVVQVLRSCREALTLFNDPTIMHKLQLQLAIAEERFQDATK
jgi:hypothetical protein